MTNHDLTFKTLAGEIKRGSVKDREKAVDDLLVLLRNSAAKIALLEDKSYHEMLEAIFNFVIIEKPILFDKSKTQAKRSGASTRLSKCASAVRGLVSRGVRKLGRKTLLAFLDHVTQILIGPVDGYVTPLLHDYLKALADVLSHPPHAECLTWKDAGSWLGCIDFLLSVIKSMLVTESVPSEAPDRDTPVAVNATMTTGAQKKISWAQSQSRSTQYEGGPLRDALDGLQHLATAASAPLLVRSTQILDIIFEVLQTKTSYLGSIQTICFLVANEILAVVQDNDFSLAIGLVKRYLPLMSFWWRAQKVSQDDLISGLRNEILKAFFLVSFYVEHIVLKSLDTTTSAELRNFGDLLWQEYSRRSDANRLQLDDVYFSPQWLPQQSLKSDVFGLRWYNIEAEGRWAVLQVMALIENILSRLPTEVAIHAVRGTENPHKRQRIGDDTCQATRMILSKDLGIQKTAIQLVPFLLVHNVLTAEDIDFLLVNSIKLTSHKDSTLSSWALIACASCICNITSEQSLDLPRQLWNLGIRKLGVAISCRASSVLLLMILRANALPLQHLSDDINNLLNGAYLDGPAILCDSSLQLMTVLLSTSSTYLRGSQISTSHAIKWFFSKWTPYDANHSSFHPQHIQPIELVIFLQYCCAMPLFSTYNLVPLHGTLSDAWKTRQETAIRFQYFLQLENKSNLVSRQFKCQLKAGFSSLQAGSGSKSSRLLVQELLNARIKELTEAWIKLPKQDGNKNSNEKVENLLIAAIIEAVISPQLNALLSSNCDQNLSCIAASLDIAAESIEPSALSTLALKILQPYLPGCKIEDLRQWQTDNVGLLRLFSLITGLLDRQRLRETDEQVLATNIDEVEEPRGESSSNSAVSMLMLRKNRQICMSLSAFLIETKSRLKYLQILHNPSHSPEYVSNFWADYLVSMSDNELLSCQRLLCGLAHFAPGVDYDMALKLIQRAGSLISKSEYRSCELALTACINIIDGVHQSCSNVQGELAESVGDLYNHFVKVCYPSNILSLEVQIAMVSLLFNLISTGPDYGLMLGRESCRTSLLSILKSCSVKVKYMIGERISEMIQSLRLCLHDEMYSDILDSLPADPRDNAGIALRINLLSKIACGCPSVLRKCVYHIFETPGKNPQATEYAGFCIRKIAKALGIGSPRDLFKTFRRQLLYTWMANNSVQSIPFSVFDYSTLCELIHSARVEAIAFAVMRGQRTSLIEISALLKQAEGELVHHSFAMTYAFSLLHKCNSVATQSPNGLDLMKKILGVKKFLGAIRSNFVGVVSHLFDVIDAKDTLQRALIQCPPLHYAASALSDLERLSISSTLVHPFQKPVHEAEVVLDCLLQSCQAAQFEVSGIWTPATVNLIARKLLTSIDPALGSVHTCSVIRRLRLLIAVAGPVALESYCLQMLLNSAATLLNDFYCLDEVVGICQYLLSGGKDYLRREPSYLAGFVVLSLISLWKNLNHCSHIKDQNEQAKETCQRVHAFCSWIESYLNTYSSLLLRQPLKMQFESIIQAATRLNVQNPNSPSELLLEIFHDATSEVSILAPPFRETALNLLNSNHTTSTILPEIIDTDTHAVPNACEIWKGCLYQKVDPSYLSWAGRTIGRTFLTSGTIPRGVNRELSFIGFCETTSMSSNSQVSLLHLLQDLTLEQHLKSAGLAEAALRIVVSQAALQKDEDTITLCRQALDKPLFRDSHWDHFEPEPSEMRHLLGFEGDTNASSEDITCASWSSILGIQIAKSMPASILLSVLPRILGRVEAFAQKAFPFLVHLVLALQLQTRQSLKDDLSRALPNWLKCESSSAIENTKLLINTVLYLRSQSLLYETSINDRLCWLDIEFISIAAAALRCGMYKTALLFAELEILGSEQGSKGVSGYANEDISHLLMSIFQKIDDPDVYYGLNMEPSLASVLSRAEFEKEGLKSLAFRGAVYDSHIRLGMSEKDADARALVGVMNTLGLCGLSQAVLWNRTDLRPFEFSPDCIYNTAQKLESWNIPVQTDAVSSVGTLYNIYHAIHRKASASIIKEAIHNGFRDVMLRATREVNDIAKLRTHLGTLAALTELEELLKVTSINGLRGAIERFQNRSKWMESGLYEIVGHILSCRGTTISLLSQNAQILGDVDVSTASLRLVQVETMLLSSKIYRYHQATQESLKIATHLNDLLPLCESLNLRVDAAVKIETAFSLWDYGEMGSSIRMLQSVDEGSILNQQTISVSRPELLSKIGEKSSIARHEKPGDIHRKYLEPALKDLKRHKVGDQEAGSVYHHFARFCDEQLQDPDGLDDYMRLQTLKLKKEEEVAELKALILKTKESQSKKRYSNVLGKERQWLDLDKQELRRVEQTRDEFLRLSLENYLLSLAISDEHNGDALRFTALWLERCNEDTTIKAVQRYLSDVPTRKFAGLMNQLTSRLQYQDSAFQRLLANLVFDICKHHPYHGMHQIWSGTRAKAQQQDDLAASRVKAAEEVGQRLATTSSVASTWIAISKTSKYYHLLAVERDSARFRSGATIPLKDSQAGRNLLACLNKYRIPPPTMHIALSADKDYSNITHVRGLDPSMTIASGVSAPKIITVLGTDGEKYKQLVKGGHDDLRQDAIMEQAFAEVSSLLNLHRNTRLRNLGIRNYKVLPLTATSGLIEFVANTIPLHEFLMPAHERYHPNDIRPTQCRKDIFGVQNESVEVRINVYRKITHKFRPVMRYFFLENFLDPDEWFERRLAYVRSTAAISVLGYVLGLGDRHGHNILLDRKTGEVVHIDLGVAFEAGRILPVPEIVPFRLTRDIVDGMGITRTEGVFRRCCEFTLGALREEQYSIMTILDVLRYDPLYTWSISPLRLAKLQRMRQEDAADVEDAESSESKARRGNRQHRRPYNEPSEADRALEVVKKKLSKTLSVTTTVNDLINQATDEKNLALLYSGEHVNPFESLTEALMSRSAEIWQAGPRMLDAQL